MHVHLQLCNWEDLLMNCNFNAFRWFVWAHWMFKKKRKLFSALMQLDVRRRSNYCDKSCCCRWKWMDDWEKILLADIYNAPPLFYDVWKFFFRFSSLLKQQLPIIVATILINLTAIETPSFLIRTNFAPPFHFLPLTLFQHLIRCNAKRKLKTNFTMPMKRLMSSLFCVWIPCRLINHAGNFLHGLIKINW